MPILGHVDEISRSRVLGWAIDPEAADANLELLIIVNGKEHGRCIADRTRPNLGSSIGADISDEHAFEYVFSPQLLTFKPYDVRVQTADGRQLGENNLLISPRHNTGNLSPLLISSRGRSGTTLLARLLKADQNFVVADIYPFEIRLVNYYVSVVKILSSITYPAANQVDFVDLSSSRGVIPGNPWNNPGLHRLAANPRLIDELFNQHVPRDLLQIFRDAVLRYYDELCRTYEKHGARFFVEKSTLDEDMRLGARTMMGAVKEVVLVRDPRDFLCSGKKFWKLQDDQLFEMARITYSRLEKIAEESIPDTLVLRYEDLIQKRPEVQQSICEFLDVSGLDLEGDDDRLFETHSTSRSVLNSIGRWREDLSNDGIAFCRTELRSAMERFGYNDSGGARLIPSISDGSNPDGKPNLRTECIAVVGSRPHSTLGLNEKASDNAQLALNELMLRFESLGENCEFGLVQRLCGAEPLGLLRFASAPLPKLLPALEARFDGVGTSVNISVELSASGTEYMVADRKFGFLYHAWVRADEMLPEEVQHREMRRLPFLVRKLIEDLDGVRKLLVCHSMGKFTAEPEIRRLATALQSYGRNTLLWIQLADETNPPGTVKWSGPALLTGYIDRFAPGDDAHNLSLNCWVAICQHAHSLWRSKGMDGGSMPAGHYPSQQESTGA